MFNQVIFGTLHNGDYINDVDDDVDVDDGDDDDVDDDVHDGDDYNGGCGGDDDDDLYWRVGTTHLRRKIPPGTKPCEGEVIKWTLANYDLSTKVQP